MVVSPDVWQLLTGPWSDRSTERRGNKLRADLEAFVKGDFITLSLEIREEIKQILELL